MSKQYETRSASFGIPSDNEPMTLKKIGKYFLEHLSGAQFTEWLAIANDHAVNAAGRFCSGRREAIREVLFNLGLTTAPVFMLSDDLDKKAACMGEQLKSALTCMSTFKEAKLAIADIGGMFLDEAGRCTSDPRLLEHNLKPNIILLIVAELYETYDFQERAAEKKKIA